jgi:hypothetical protein
VRELVGLDRQQRRRHDEREVLGPAALVPQPYGLDALHERVDDEDEADEPQRARPRRERALDLVQEAVAGRVGAPRAELQVREDLVEASAQRVAM